MSGLSQNSSESRQLVRNIMISGRDGQCKNLFVLSFVHLVLTHIEKTLQVLIQASPFREPNLVIAVTVPEIGQISQSQKAFST